MKILFLHSAYANRGGEEVSLEVDAQLLRDHGHDVVISVWPNSKLGRFEAATRQIWSNRIWGEVSKTVDRAQPDVVDVTNTSWALGSTAIAALHALGTPIVARLNNQRLRFGLRELIHEPYNGSRLQSAALVLGNALHKSIWTRKVDRFIAVSQYIQKRMVAAGFPIERISVRGDTVYPAPKFQPEPGDRFLFVGRICPEKGVPLLQEAWKHLALGRFELDVVGKLPAQPREQVGITWHGALPHEQVLDMMAKARAVIVPSVWPEPSGRVVYEAMACGTPVITSDAGGLPETQPAQMFMAGNVETLVAAVRDVASWGPDIAVRHRLLARATWEKYASPERQLEKLIGNYQLAIAHRAARKHPRLVIGDLDDPATREHLARFDAARRTEP
jgi:glycosyltransferase involved in cell wall biosynthesis